jgi:hypothetical protein
MGQGLGDAETDPDRIDTAADAVLLEDHADVMGDCERETTWRRAYSDRAGCGSLPGAGLTARRAAP